jgi:hypothetical protein
MKKGVSPRIITAVIDGTAPAEIAHPFADHLALELGERQQDIEREPPHAGCRVEGLRDRDEGRRVEDLDQLGKIGLCPAKASISRNSRPP